MIFESKLEGSVDLIKDLNACPDAAEKAIVRTCNDLAKQGVTISKRKITNKYNIRSRDLGPSSDDLLKGTAKSKIYKIIKAQRFGKSGQRMFSTIQVMGDSLQLFLFGALPQEPKQKGIPIKQRKPATVKVFKDGSRIRLSNKLFVAKMGSGHVGIFKRTGTPMAGNKSKEGISERFAPGVVHMFEKFAVDEIDKLINTKGIQLLQHNLNFYLGNLNKPVSDAPEVGSDVTAD